MIKFVIAAIASLLLISGANAQQFPGYGPSGGIFVAQGNSLLPTWLFLNGDCTSTVGAAITCTKTNGVPFYTGLSTPVNPADAATKNYVDMNSTGLTIHTAVALATAAALPTNTYNNGTAGVGATLTATANGALSVDGTVVTSAQRILVKNEAAPANNGIYTVTTVGTGGTPYVLTRTTDANTAGTQDPNKIGNGSYAFVSSGVTLLNTAWVVNSTVTTIGTSAINWSQFSASSGVSSIGGLQGAFTCSSGINCASNILALTAARQTLPTHQVFLSGSGTYTRPANVLWIEITLVGGGGGGGGAGGNGTAAGATCWNTTGAACTTPVYSAGGGGPGSGGGSGGTGGVITGSGTCDWAVVGGGGGGGAQSIVSAASGVGGIGGSSTLGGAGASTLNASGSTAAVNSGSGGGGGGAQSGASLATGGGGGSGATCHVIINNPASTYTYAIGAAGSGGSAVSFGFLGGGGSAGQIIVYEHYGS